MLISTRSTIQLNPQAVATDVAEFQRARLAAHRAPPEDQGKTALLEKAVECYQGALLSGFYEEWIGIKAQRLEEEYFALLGELLEHLEAENDWTRALHFAREGVHRDASRLETRSALKRFCRALDVNFDALNLPSIGDNDSASTPASAAT